jgi:hypothetical protein
MRLQDWLDASGSSIKSFAATVKVERAMIYRYFAGAIPRAQTIWRIEMLTNGAVTAQDFYDNALRTAIPAQSPNGLTTGFNLAATVSSLSSGES